MRKLRDSRGRGTSDTAQFAPKRVGPKTVTRGCRAIDQNQNQPPKQYYKWEQEILDHGKVVDATQVNKVQDKVILAKSFTDLKELIDIKSESGSSFTLSSSEPFDEEMEIEYDKFVNWLDHSTQDSSLDSLR